jgi:hypothetical protein
MLAGLSMTTSSSDWWMILMGADVTGGSCRWMRCESTSCSCTTAPSSTIWPLSLMRPSLSASCCVSCVLRLVSHKRYTTQDTTHYTNGVNECDGYIVGQGVGRELLGEDVEHGAAHPSPLGMRLELVVVEPHSSQPYHCDVKISRKNKINKKAK